MRKVSEPTDGTPRSPRGGAWRRLALAASALALCGPLIARAAPAAPPQGEAKESLAERFRLFEAAWEKEDASQLVNRLPEKSRLSLLLLGRPFSGKRHNMLRDQASESLASYFKDICHPVLADVTPREQKASEHTIRFYDYSYRPRKGNATTTRLVARLKKDAQSRWVLDSVSERRK